MSIFDADNNEIPLPGFNSKSFSWQKTDSYPGWRKTADSDIALGFDANGKFSTSVSEGVEIYIRPNKYDIGRAHIIVFNWSKSEKVSIDLNEFLQKGTYFEIRNVQDYFAEPVVSGVYDGKPVKLPMVNLTAAKPAGWDRVLGIQTWPEFNVFVLIAKYPSIPQMISPSANQKSLKNPVLFKLKSFSEFDVRFIIEMKRGNNTSIFTTPYTTSGNELEYSIPERIPSGEYTVRIKSQDKYGRESQYTRTFKLRIG